MNKKYQFDPRGFDVALIATRSSKQRHVEVQIIRSVRDLFVWMWQQLEASQPTVAVEEYARACLEDLSRALLLGEPLTIAPMMWPEIFGNIRWQDISSQEGNQVSVALLAFMGHVCSYVKDFGDVSTAQACEMMFDCSFHSGRYIKYGEWGETSRLIVSTPACERLLGVKIQVRVNCPALDELWWCM